MNLKQLIKEVERLNKNVRDSTRLLQGNCTYCEELTGKLKGIKQTVEAVDKEYGLSVYVNVDKDWQTLKKLLGVK